MSRVRYFINKFPDYAESQAVEIPKEALYEQIQTIKKKIFSKYAFDKHCCDGGLYVGVAGIAYGLTRLLEIHQDDQQVHQFIEKSIKISVKYEDCYQPREVKPGLLLGSGGVLVAAALYQKQIGGNDSQKEVSKFLRSYGDLGSICNQPAPNQDYLRCGSDEVLLGRAGYLCGIHTIAKMFSIQVLDDKSVSEIFRTIIDVGRQTSRQLSSASPLMYHYHNTQYLGAAHGLSGILFALLNFPKLIKSDKSVERDIKGSVDYFLSIQQEDGNFAAAADEVHQVSRPGEGLVHWCHGAPGVIYLLAKAFRFWQEEKYLNACVKCADLCWKYGLLRKGPGICHGIAGNGYVFLLMYRLTNQPKYLYRAIRFAEFLDSDEFKREARVPDSPFSLFEGWAGTLCFLRDLLEPDKAEFPFYEVF